ncbi:hypothetical protein H696_00849 [Fonticula alba]|uniref:Peptide deformylase n=1 Tax=Fonticula alba TaxID=691883 RepID=A0A058ZH93_FONAL|nr:hypothetical protein H696_00849 [Fonticula alba]KCV73308.1 hypothetical protein H696_00849 [Fonticula alba]|eukprot:XP_009493009.1 hypothetical protein H696_00849 [Fonticula alba]
MSTLSTPLSVASRLRFALYANIGLRGSVRTLAYQDALKLGASSEGREIIERLEEVSLRIDRALFEFERSPNKYPGPFQQKMKRLQDMYSELTPDDLGFYTLTLKEPRSLTIGHPLLRQRSLPVDTTFYQSEDMVRAVHAMKFKLDYDMEDFHLTAISAVQVGMPIRCFHINYHNSRQNLELPVFHERLIKPLSLKETGPLGGGPSASSRRTSITPRNSPARIEPVFLLNPTVTPTSLTHVTYNIEGCLSVPGMAAMVARPDAVRLDAVNLDLVPVSATLTGLPAAVVCHEIDHMDGILFTDRAALPTMRTMENILNPMPSKF